MTEQSNALEAFEKFLKQKSLSNEKDRDVWGEEIFKHPKIEAMWYAWKNCHEQALTQQGWQPIDGKSKSDVFFAYDSHNDSVGVWDGYTFNSVPEKYSFSDVYTDGDQWVFYNLKGDVCGVISHWMPIMPPTQGDSE